MERAHGSSTSIPAGRDVTQRRGGWRKRQQGIALVAVLWILALLGIIAAGLLRETRVETGLARNLVENAKAEMLADAGVQRAMLGLLDPNEETAWRADGATYEFRLGDGMVRLSVQDEAGKIDLNYAPDELLFALFVGVGLGADEADSLVDAIAAFRGRGDERRPAPAQDAEDIAAALPQDAAHAPFGSVEDLLRISGLTRDIYELIAPNVTVYSGSAEVDPASAPAAVLQVLPEMTSEQREEILARRQNGTASMPSRPDTVTVSAEASTANGGAFIREVVLWRTGDATQPFQILAWRQRWRTMPLQAPPRSAAD